MLLQAGLDGTVPACNKCIRNSDSRTVSLWISNFPYIDPNNFAAVAVTFGTVLCDGVVGKDGRVCVVRSVETISDAATAEPLLYLTVSVPSAPGGAAVPVTVQVRLNLGEGVNPCDFFKGCQTILCQRLYCSLCFSVLCGPFISQML